MGAETQRASTGVQASLPLFLWGVSFAGGKVCAGFKIDAGGTDNRGAHAARRLPARRLAGLNACPRELSGGWCPTRQTGGKDARMTTAVHTDPRRTSQEGSRKPGRPPLEMPVLFQLADLSLPQIKGGSQVEKQSATALKDGAQPVAKDTAQPVLQNAVPAAKKETPHAVNETVLPLTQETAPAIASEPAPVVQELPRSIPEASPTPAIIQPEPSTAAENPVPEIKDAAPVAKPEITIAMSAAEPLGAKEAQAGSLSHEIAPSSAEQPATTAVTPSPTDVTPPTEATAPTPRERTEQKARTKGRQTAPPGSDWMRTHGKYIAVGFVFALIATIYMARSGDEPAPAHRDAAATSADENGAAASESETHAPGVQTAKEAVSAGGPQVSPA